MMIEQLAEQQAAGAAVPSAVSGRAALLLCYIKRRCSLFFREREANMLPSNELSVYMDELAEIGGYAGVQTIVTNVITAAMHGADIPVRYATLFYDFLYYVIDRAAAAWKAGQNYTSILANIAHEHENITMRLTLPGETHAFRMNADLGRAVEAAGGVFAVKDLDDAAGLSLSFPLGKSNG